MSMWTKFYTRLILNEVSPSKRKMALVHEKLMAEVGLTKPHWNRKLSTACRRGVRGGLRGFDEIEEFC
jgi:hypothetical protein